MGHRYIRRNPSHYTVEENAREYNIKLDLPEDVQMNIARIQQLHSKDSALVIQCSSAGYVLEVDIETVQGDTVLSRVFTLSDDVAEGPIHSAILKGGTTLLVVVPKKTQASTSSSSSLLESQDKSDPTESTAEGSETKDPVSSIPRSPKKQLESFLRRRRRRQRDNEPRVHCAETVVHT